MIKVSHLTKSFDSRVILDDLSLDIARGEILVILGSSGTGKSVLLGHLIGLLRPDSGTIEIDGMNITDMPERKLLEVRKQMGYLFQDGALYDFMTVYENLIFPLFENTKLSRNEIDRKAMDMLEQVDLVHARDQYPSELSGGMRKRAALGRCLILNAKVLLCDEPTSGLDPIRSRDISELIRDLSKKMNCTTVMTSHDLANSFRVADQLVLLNQGKIAASGTQKDLQASTAPFVQEFLA